MQLPEKSSPLGPKYDPASPLRFSKVLPPVRKAYISRSGYLAVAFRSPRLYGPPERTFAKRHEGRRVRVMDRRRVEHGKGTNHGRGLSLFPPPRYRERWEG